VTVSQYCIYFCSEAGSGSSGSVCGSGSGLGAGSGSQLLFWFDLNSLTWLTNLNLHRLYKFTNYILNYYLIRLANLSYKNEAITIEEDK
jgi:hypothetical protein